MVKFGLGARTATKVRDNKHWQDRPGQAPPKNSHSHRLLKCRRKVCIQLGTRARGDIYRKPKRAQGVWQIMVKGERKRKILPCPMGETKT